MKVFASVIALLLTSAASASEIHQILTHSSVAEAVSVYHEAQDDADVDVPCADQAIAFFGCLGDEFTGCFLDLITDLEEDTTCAELKDSDFCPELAKCELLVAEGTDCTTQGEELKSCAAAAYPDHEGCGDDLCTAEEVAIAVEVISPTDAMSLSHVVKAVSVYHEAQDDPDVDVACADQVIAFFGCLGDEFTGCFFDLIVDLEEDTTCAELKDSDFCPELAKCELLVAEGTDCTTQVEDLKSCAAAAYPDHEGCGDDLCTTDVAIFSIA